MNVEEDKEVGRAVALVLAVVTFPLAGLGGNGLAHLANRLGRALVEADHRPLGIGGFRVEVEHILHAGDILGIDLGNAPHVFAPWLQIVLSQPPAHRFAGELFMVGQPDQFTGQQFQRPAGTANRRL